MISHRRVQGVLLALAAGFAASSSALTPAVDPPVSGGRLAGIAADHVPGEILIKFRGRTGMAEHARARAAVSATILGRFRSGAEHWRMGGGVTTEEAIAQLEGDPQVEYVEPDYIVRADVVPNDPRYSSLWALHNTGQAGGAPGADIKAEAAWEITTGSRSVLVGVIDSGVDYRHPDLAANVWTNPGEIPGNLIDDDHNGFVDDVHGWDFANDDNDPFDDYLHGTHVSGTIGAVGDNRYGVTGVNWQVSLVPVKFTDSKGNGPISSAIAAIEYATSLHVNLMNNSWGGDAFSQALLDAVNEAADANILFVASAGNDHLDDDLVPHYPASFDAPNVVAVGATTGADRLASFSGFGRKSVDLGAPGFQILSTIPTQGFQTFNGTSMATPHVTGVAALMLAAHPGLSAVDLKQALLDTIDPLPALAAITVSGGRLNAARALAALDAGPPVADLTPDSIRAALPSAGAGSRTLHLTNSGEADLVWEVFASSPGSAASPRWIAAAPALGVIAAGESIDNLVTLDASTLMDGDAEAILGFQTNDPSRRRIDAGVRLHVGEATLDLFLLEPMTLNLASRGRSVRASIQLPPAYDPHDVSRDSVRLSWGVAPERNAASFADE